MIRFTSIPFVVVKLKNFKVCRTNSTTMLGPFRGCFLLISPQYVVQFWSNFDPHLTPWIRQKLKKKSCPKKKLIIGLSKYIKTKSPLPFLGKLGYILHFWVENRWASQVKWSESKLNAAHFTQMVVNQRNPPKFLFQDFTILRL